MKETLEQERKRWKYGWSQLGSRIEWLEAKKQQGTGQSKLRVSGDPVGFQERAGVFLGESVHVMPGRWSSRLLSAPLKWWYAGLNGSPILIDAFFPPKGEPKGDVVCRLEHPRDEVELVDVAVVTDLFWVVMRSCIRVMAPKEWLMIGALVYR